MPFITKPPVGGEAGGSGYAKDDDSFASSFPALVEFMTLTEWDDKTKRKTGTVMLMVDAGVCKAWVHDKDAKRSTFLSSDTFWGLLEALERGLREDTLGWRSDRR